MEAVFAELSRAAPAPKLLGWLNLSDGRPDPRWQRQWDDAFAVAAAAQPQDPWSLIRSWLNRELHQLEKAENAAFRDTTQTRAALDLVFDHVLPAYRRHHADLLAHAADADLFSAYFLARVCEAVLGQGSPWNETGRIVDGALQKLNDYVGHRPVPVLESRAQHELYAHEKLRPVPLYLHGAGPAKSRFGELVGRALDLLRATDSDLLSEACFDPELLEELAVDPRAYDHGHPANRRPNYIFGEWDPHHIDNRGRFRRFVVRRCTLDAICARVDQHPAAEREEYCFEAAAVLAGTILMAAGTSGAGPNTFDSSVTLSKLIPRIARYRDAFYKRLITAVEGKHGERLRAEAAQWRQPFALARQNLNQELARQRAEELQDSMLSLIFAEMGYPDASRDAAQKVPAASVRMLVGIRSRLAECRQTIARKEYAVAARLLEECENLLERGIQCGALADPWNALGFQGLFPLFTSREDAIHDPRLEDLIDTVGRIFYLYSETLSGAASDAVEEIRRALSRRLDRLAKWWDRHATFEVNDLPRVHGGELASAAEHVANALGGIRSAPGGASDLAYWRQQREGFTSAAAFAQVVEALFRQGDVKASLSLLMTWLSEAATTPLEDGDASFSVLSRRWLESVIHSTQLPATDALALVIRFFALLEANAEDYWAPPTLQLEPTPSPDDDPVESAFEEMSYRDRTDDGGEGALLGGEASSHFPLESEASRLGAHLTFLATIGQLWQVAVPFLRAQGAKEPETARAVKEWRTMASQWLTPLQSMLDQLYELEVPEPMAGFEDVMEFDRRRHMRDQLADDAIDTCLEISHAIRLLGSLTPVAAKTRRSDPGWETAAQDLVGHIGRRDARAVRRVLPSFLKRFRTQPLLFVPMSAGGQPAQILRARQSQTMLRFLLVELPRLGLVRETYHLIRLARQMEQNAMPEGRKVSEFDHLFPIALQATLDALLDAAHSWPAEEIDGEDTLIELLRRITDSFLSLWLDHSQTLRLSMLESVTTNAQWDSLREFIRKFGSDLFTPQFLALANLRSLVHRGIAVWLDGLSQSDEAPALVEALERGEYDRQAAINHLETIVHAMIEHHEEYRDYNSTTTQSDYGENLHLLLDFLKLKIAYDRFAWRMRPLVMAHAVLCRRGQDSAAVRWQTSMSDFTQKRAEQLLANLSELERKHGLRLRTIRDRLEERFVRPLIVDRLCAAVEPAMREAANPTSLRPAFARLQAQLPVLTATPIGIGLDPPDWLERLDDEVQHIGELIRSGERTNSHGLAPGVHLSFKDLQRQLEQWETPV